MLLLDDYRVISLDLGCLPYKLPLHIKGLPVSFYMADRSHVQHVLVIHSSAVFTHKTIETDEWITSTCSTCDNDH